jgi:hypothetical protein
MLSEQLGGSDRAPLRLSHRDYRRPQSGTNSLSRPASAGKDSWMAPAMGLPRAGKLFRAAHVKNQGWEALGPQCGQWVQSQPPPGGASGG